MKKTNKYILIIISVLLLLSVLPGILLTLESIPRPGDDYESSITVVHVWNSTHNIFAMMKEAWNQTIAIYYNQQGSLAAAFIMCMSPIVFSLTAYRVVMFIFALFFLFAACYFVNSFLVKRFKMDKHYSFFIFCLFVFTAIYFNMNSEELLYWFNGSSYYFLTFSVFLIFVSLLNELCLENSKTDIIRTILLCLMAIFIALNNLAMSIMCLVTLFFALIYSLRSKEKASKEIVIVLAVFSGFLLVNLLAPGYRVKISTLDTEMGTEQIGAVSTMIQSFELSLKELVKIYLKLSPLPIVMLLSTPILIVALRISNFKGYKPVLIAAATLLIYIAQYPPIVMVYGQRFLPRITNIRFLTAQIWFILNYINVAASIINTKIYDRFGFNEKNKARLLYGVLVVFAFLNIGLIAKHEVGNDLNITTMIKEWRSGEIGTFIEESESRLDVLNDGSVNIVEFKPMTYQYTILGWDLISEDKNDIISVQLSEFYDKEAIYAVK